jgi:hypothetical protein
MQWEAAATLIAIYINLLFPINFFLYLHHRIIARSLRILHSSLIVIIQFILVSRFLVNMSPYAAAYANPKGPGDARPTFLQIIHDESLDGKLVGKVVVITGTTSGIGLETARALSATGATLFLTARDMKKAETRTRSRFARRDGQRLFRWRSSCCATILTKSNNRVNILVNNAGVMGIEEIKLTEDGNEMHFATNHLSHFLLFQLLKPALLASSTPNSTPELSTSFRQHIALATSTKVTIIIFKREDIIIDRHMQIRSLPMSTWPTNWNVATATKGFMD